MVHPRLTTVIAPAGAPARPRVASRDDRERLIMIDVDALLRVQAETYRAGGSLAAAWPPESAMDAGELASFLEKHRYCVLATAEQDHPIAWPTLFTFLGAAFWFASTDGVRLGNARPTRWGSLVIIEGEPGEHHALAADGPLTVTEHPWGQLRDVWHERHGLDEEWSGLWLQLTPRRLYSFTADNTDAR